MWFSAARILLFPSPTLPYPTDCPSEPTNSFCLCLLLAFGDFGGSRESMISYGFRLNEVDFIKYQELDFQAFVEKPLMNH